METKNYTLGRGRVYFAPFIPGTLIPDGFRYIGNTPEFSLSIESEELDHFNSDEGIREKDDSATLEVNRTGSMITDNIVAENVALFFFGEAAEVAQASVASGTEILASIREGHAYNLGVTDQNPTGYFGIDPAGLSLTDGTTPLSLGVDFNIDYDSGLVSFIAGSALAVTGADIQVTYAVLASTRSRVISGDQAVEGAMQYITKNPKGTQSVFNMPYVKVTPNGDFALKGDEWQQLPLSLEILKATGKEAIYRDGTPAIA